MPAATEIVRAVLSASAENYESALPYIHDDFEMDTPPGLAAEPQHYSGPEGVRRWWESFFEVMDRVQLRALEIVETERADLVAGELEIVARGRASGVEAVQRAAVLCTIADGKIKRIDYFATLADARAAAGATS